MRIAVFASGSGSNFQAIAESVQAGKIDGEIVLLFSDQKDAKVLERAEKLGIPSASFSPKDFSSKGIYEAELLHLLEEKEVELIVLAGYMRLIGPVLLEAYPEKIINIHPSLLPLFPGLHGIRDAFEAKVEETGVTIHFIDKGIDTGPVIVQEKVAIHSDDTLEGLEEKIHKVEHRLYPIVIQKIIKEKKER
ncbi:phosphoribosylglycinamide formyltransferase [Enterococcus sp. CWB-B31]|uniref:phosphoribosylglycinamide formyltransferase n=1 Tax=Enterococcus sp. CWB-B31 TaxID=2885159 RepID=UPI001E524F77|nr:phosphoribosylglycinamide formyltransferase [Enterococcus sp. CWB-B31]MCB5955149.1 phosphoribosylglycinamide formyltransferase [Enterococcus sp. CWB-B31]